MGAASKPNKTMSHSFKKPRGPINAIKAVATTTVGNTNGKVESDNKRALPRNWQRVKTKAAGNYLAGDNEHGELKLFDENGELIKKMNCNNGLCQTSWTKEENEDVFGPCANENWHGHNYDLFVTIKGEPDPITGFCMDLKDLSKIINSKVIDKLDH